ncbi:hypothetical protein, partial [Streptococcus pneumoniae]|uniref:hypothetical protein n=1 Tax=Streptococcus pneumoniae TaxID=1313 RepID=UPI003F690431
ELLEGTRRTNNQDERREMWHEIQRILQQDVAYDMNINGSVVDADPDDGHWNFFHSQGPWNTYGYNNPRVDELLEGTRRTNNQDERREMWHEIQRILQQDVAY